jgi:hypothetical protein
MSEIKVNKVTPRSGSTVTLGESGDTIALGACASQTGFGRTGTVDWCTTAKTSPFTAESGKGYMVNTCGGIITATLPSSPSAGDIVSLADYKSTWDSNAVTLGRGGSKINGGCFDSTLDTVGQSITMVYIDGTQGWKNTMDSTSNVTGEPNYVTATGGSPCAGAISGDYKIHTFTGDGSFVVTGKGTPAGSNIVSYMVVAGGGGGGGDHGGGGGAGGFREGKCSSDPYTDSPLDAGAGVAVPVQSYSITVGGGGAGGFGQGAPSPNAPQGSIGIAGGNSVFSSITSAGGGGGAKEPVSPYAGQNSGTGTPGGSGGGGSYGAVASPTAGVGGSGNDPPVAPPQGNNGGNGDGAPGSGAPQNSSGAGGGATAVGGNAPGPNGGAGGAGATTSISASPVVYGGGGGGGAGAAGTGGAAGPGGGGAGGDGSTGTAGTVNTGGGGGGSYPDPQFGGAGGSGIIILRYKFQN